MWTGFDVVAEAGDELLSVGQVGPTGQLCGLGQAAELLAGDEGRVDAAEQFFLALAGHELGGLRPDGRSEGALDSRACATTGKAPAALEVNRRQGASGLPAQLRVVPAFGAQHIVQRLASGPQEAGLHSLKVNSVTAIHSKKPVKTGVPCE